MHVVGDVVFDESEAIAPDEMLNVRGAAGDQVVHADHLVSASEEQLAEV